MEADRKKTCKVKLQKFSVVLSSSRFFSWQFDNIMFRTCKYPRVIQ